MPVSLKELYILGKKISDQMAGELINTAMYIKSLSRFGLWSEAMGPSTITALQEFIGEGPKLESIYLCILFNHFRVQ